MSRVATAPLATLGNGGRPTSPGRSGRCWSRTVRTETLPTQGSWPQLRERRRRASTSTSLRTLWRHPDRDNRRSGGDQQRQRFGLPHRMRPRTTPIWPGQSHEGVSGRQTRQPAARGGGQSLVVPNVKMLINSGPTVLGRIPANVATPRALEDVMGSKKESKGTRGRADQPVDGPAGTRTPRTRPRVGSGHEAEPTCEV